MLELITPPFTDPEGVLRFLDDLHVLVHRHIGNELLWPASMPCILRPGAVRIAEYGSSPQGLLRHVYRIGLGHRYGRLMQTVAGVHFNYSFPEALWTRDKEDGGEERNRRLMDEIGCYATASVSPGFPAISSGRRRPCAEATVPDTPSPPRPGLKRPATNLTPQPSA
jgi:gamma-glutamylcysteine synthetase